jgi:hypothetical protein
LKVSGDFDLLLGVGTIVQDIIRKLSREASPKTGRGIGFAGVVTLCPVVNNRTAKAPEKSASIEIHNANNASLIYPLESDKNVTVEFSWTNFTFSTRKQ